MIDAAENVKILGTISTKVACNGNEYSKVHSFTLYENSLGLVVQRRDNAIHWINHYPADSVVYFVNTYPLDSDLSGG